MLIPIAAFAMVIFIVWLKSRETQAKVQARADLNRQLLDKFASAQELTNFLDRESGQRFLDGVGSEKLQGPKERILGIITPGCVITSIGIGFLAVSTNSPDLRVAGVTILAAGIGLLIAAVVTYVLSRAWGLMNGKDGSRGRSS